MVVFVCEACHDSFSRPKLRKHLEGGRCCGARVSCLDCRAHFDVSTFEGHKSCISEQEQYTGRTKKNTFTEHVEAALQVLGPSAKQLLETAIDKVGVESLPKRKPKFLNLCKNIMGGRVDVSQVDAVWEAIDSSRQERIKEEERSKRLRLSKSEGGEEDLKEESLKNGKGEEESVENGKGEENLKGEESPDFQALKRRLKKMLKQDNSMSCSKAQQDLGVSKKILKALVQQHPGKFEIARHEETGVKFVKRLHM